MSTLAPLSGAARGRVRAPQPFLARLQQWLSNYLPLALMAVLALFTTWLVRQAPGAGPAAPEGPVRTTPDYQMRGFELQRFAPDGRAQGWLRGAALRHYPSDDRVEFDRIELRVEAEDGSWLLAESEQAVGPQTGDWLKLKGSVRVRRFAAGADPQQAAPLLELHTSELLAEREGRRLSSRSSTQVRTPRSQGQVAGFRYEHGSGRLDFEGPSRFEFPAARLQPPRRP